MLNVKKKLSGFAGSIFGDYYYRLLIGVKLRSYSNREPILIWQMGKVGSSTIYESVKRALPASPVFHVHVLSERLIARGEAYKRAMKEHHKAYKFNICLRQHLQNRSIPPKWKIITLVREPVARNLSSFFQNLDLYLDRESMKMVEKGCFPNEELKAIFLEQFDHGRPLQWFECEIKGLLGFDVFATPFPIDQGYQIYSSERYDLLLMRMEDIDSVGIDAMKKFLGLSDFEMVRTNLGEKKRYAKQYSDFKKSITFDRKIMNRMYESPYAMKFYSETELEAMRRTWSS